jgi:beta-lactamase superfamily II metal-dependent hydrolase
MYYSSYKRYYPEDVLIYVEEFNKELDTVLFDFIDSNEHTLFTELGGLQTNLLNPSMVYLSNYKLRTIQENTIYAIKQSVIESWRDQSIIVSNNENSFLIGFTIELPDNTTNEIFGDSVSLNDFDDVFLNFYMNGNGDNSALPVSVEGRLSVTIRNVGQGNWNEIKGNRSPKIVYDAGAPMFASRTEVRAIIGNKPMEYNLSTAGLILSHWDKDHYHSLIGMSDAELGYFSYFICRDRVPNLTSRILFNRIRNVVGAINVFTLPAELRTSRGGPTLFVPKTPIRRQVMLYNAQYHKNRNISGIVLSVKTRTASIILSGDAHYPQISRDILIHLNYPHNHYLVVPHHGGKAGNYAYSLPNRVIPNDAIISVGRNHYHHPYTYYTNALNSDGFNVLQTQIRNNDITITL